MAIKINLLPQSYALKKARMRWGLAMATLLGLTGLSIGLLYASDQKQLQKVKKDVANIEPIAAQTEAANSAMRAAESESAPIKTVVSFMADASKTGPERAALLDLMRRYIYERAVVSSLDLSSGTDAKITATVNTPDDYFRYLISLRKGTAGDQIGAGKVFDETSQPTASGIPGFPEGRPLPDAASLSYTPTPIVFPFPISSSGKLKSDANTRNNLLYVPVEPPGTSMAAGAVQGGGSGGGPGGGPSGYPGASGPSSSASPSASGAPAR